MTLRASAKSSGPRAAEWLAVLLCGVIYLALCFSARLSVDDAFISFRYARNLAAGEGLRFNPGSAQPVEGFSNLLWILWCALIDRLGGDPVVAAVSTAILSGLLSLGLVFLIARRWSGGAVWPPFLAVFLVAANPSFALWATSGLETVPFALLLLLLTDLLLLRPDPVDWRIAAAVALALLTLRVDGFVYVGSITIAAWWQHRSGGRGPIRAWMGRYLGTILAGAVLLVLFRWLYFGDLVPNAVRLKLDLEPSLLPRGLAYVAQYARTLLTPLVWLLLIPLSLGRDVRRRGIPLSMLLLVTIGIAVRAGGDWMPMGRLLVPALPISGLLLGLCLADPWRKLSAAMRTAIVCGLVSATAVSILPAWTGSPEPRSGDSSSRSPRSTGWGSADAWRMIWRMRLGHDRDRRSARELGRCAQPGDSIVSGIPGTVGYYADLQVYDRSGLLDRRVARRTVGRLGAPGHDKTVPATFFLDRRPTYLHAESWRREEASSLLDPETRRRLIRGAARRDYDLDVCADPRRPEERILVLVRRREEGRSAAEARRDLRRKVDRLLTPDGDGAAQR